MVAVDPVRLCVNVDHVATVRNARGTPYPDPVHLAVLALNAGADGIVAHLREDRRHIRERDVEILRAMAEFLQPLAVDEATLALDAIAEVGPGGHFFGAAHTLERFETAFWTPLLSDWRNFEQWQSAGSPTASRAISAAAVR